MENLNDLPQLIIGLDEDDNYIHIRDAKDKDYFCPCCKNIIKPRAYKQDIEYQVQPHFYHVNGNCNEESRIHWLYKNWLFKKGSQFYVNENLYTVNYVEIEKSYETSFGLYKPDITVHLDNGNIIFFEINFTSSKNENNYFAKWSELNIDVIEVNIKKLMNEDYNCEIPIFDLVYSDGECFKKTYSRKDDYSYIAKQKKEWERQDKINYKIMWERLDWFWLKLQEFKHDKCEIKEVIDGFKNIDISDKEICFDLIKKQSCVKSYNQEFRDAINEEIKEKLSNLDFAKNLFNYENIIQVFENCNERKYMGIILKLYLRNKNIYTLNLNIISKEWIFRYTKLESLKEIFKEKLNKLENEESELFEIENIINNYLLEKQKYKIEEIIINYDFEQNKIFYKNIYIKFKEYDNRIIFSSFNINKELILYIIDKFIEEHILFQKFKEFCNKYSIKMERNYEYSFFRNNKIDIMYLFYYNEYEYVELNDFDINKMDNEEIEIYIKNLSNYIKMKKEINKIMDKLINQNKLNRIWILERIEENEFIISIKNYYKEEQCSIIKINYNDIYKFDKNELIDFCKNKLKISMEYIYDYVNECDGIESEYRHMFVNRKE